MEYIDLGLKSRTLWGSDYEKDEQGNCLYLTFDEAKERFGDSLPDPWQFQELKDSCKWEWDGKKQGYKVTGPNGNSIFLAAMGFRRTDGVTALVGEYGTYWSSAPLGGDSGYYLNFGSSYHNPVNNGSRSHGRAIIRVKQAERARPVYYIKGDNKRGEEVIKMLEKEGGYNEESLNGNNPKFFYYLNVHGAIAFIETKEEQLLKAIGTELHLPPQYKEVPFDIETAKKIQRGEIGGKIENRTGKPVRIICFDAEILQCPIVALCREKTQESIGFYTDSGRHMLGCVSPRDLKLFIKQ